MKITLGIKEMSMILVLLLVLVLSVYFSNLKSNSIGHGYNTIVTKNLNVQNAPHIGACTGALGQSKYYLLDAQKAAFNGQVPQTLQYLDNLTISCNGPADILKLNDNFTNLGGQCCGVVTNLTEYNEQLEGLKQFSSISFIPKNPYNVSVASAKEFIGYDLNTTLSADKQAVLDQASTLSSEGGPCCCKCWHWYFNEGIAKRLILDYNFTAQRVATFYDLSDICGA